jgi:hypothetical protein
MMLRAGWTIAALLTAFVASQEPRADDELPPIVLLMSLEECCPDEAWPEVEKAVAAELEALRLRVHLVNGEDSRARGDELDRVALEHGAACAIRIARATGDDPSGVEIWIADRATDKTTMRRIEVEEKDGGSGVAIAALRTVEALRASLLELRITRSAPAELTPAPELVEIADEVKVDSGEERPAKPHRFGLALGFGPSGSPGGVGVIGSVVAVAGWHAIEHLSIEIDGALSAAGEDIEQSGARSTFDYATVRAWASWDIRGRGVLRPMLALGGGPLFSWTEGQDTEGFAGSTELATVAYLGGAAQLGIAVARSFWLRLGARVGALLPEVRVEFAGDEVASFGQPLVEGFALVEVRFL